MTPERIDAALAAAREVAVEVEPRDVLGRVRGIRDLMARDLWAVGRSSKLLAELWQIPHSTVLTSSQAASHSLRIDAAPGHVGVATMLTTVEESAEPASILARRLVAEGSSGDAREVLSIAQAYAAVDARRSTAAEQLAKFGGMKPEDTRPMGDGADDDAKPELDELTVEELEALRVLELGKIRRSGA